MVVRVAALALLLGACSGKTKGVEDARKHIDSGSARDPTLPPPTGDGDVQLRVEWKDVPIEARASSGRTPCNTPRAPSVEPTTTWGIPDIVVMIDAPAKPAGTGSGSAQPATPREARVVLDHCALTPRIAIATDKVVLASAADAPAKLALTKFPNPFVTMKIDAVPGTPRLVYLPISGHSVNVAVEATGAYHVEIATDDGKGRDVEDAWVVVATSPYVGITEPSGQVLLRDVPVGTYTATAWLPPRAGQPARIAHAPVTVTDGGIADITLDISK